LYVLLTFQLLKKNRNLNSYLENVCQKNITNSGKNNFFKVWKRFFTLIQRFSNWDWGRDPFKGHQMFLKGHQMFLKGHQMFLKGHQSLPGLPSYLRFDVVCDNLGSRKFWKYLERVRDSGYKKFENPCLNLYTDKKRERGQKRKECKNLIHCQFPPWLLYRANSY
jgi:hypothetical protein